MVLERGKTTGRVKWKAHVCCFTGDVADTGRKQEDFTPRKAVLMTGARLQWNHLTYIHASSRSLLYKYIVNITQEVRI